MIEDRWLHIGKSSPHDRGLASSGGVRMHRHAGWGWAAAPLLLLSCLPTGALAQVSPGWWWNRAEPGRGFFIEQQGASLFVAGYLYADSGRATWVTSNLSTSAANDFAGTLQGFSGGQTLSGAWQQNAPTSPSPGNLRLQFSDSTHATLTWPGGSFGIERAALIAGGVSAPIPVGTPEAGWWWNPAEPGRGFSIEIQNGIMFLGGFMYDSTGRPVWYASGQAPMTDPTHYNGQWSEYANGQTLTGTFRPAMLASANAGAVSVAFESSISAKMRMPDGRTNPLSRVVFSSQPAISWTPALTVTAVALSGTTHASSSRLRVSWSPPAGITATRYELKITDQVSRQPRTLRTATTSAEITGLAAATAFQIEVTVCTNTRCYLTQTASTSGQTPTEIWQLQGSGNNVAGLRRIVADGNVKLHAFRYGPDAPANLAGRLQLYYGAMGSTVRGLAVASTTLPATAANPASYLDFVSFAGSSGLLNPITPATLVRDVATGQAVPLMSGLVRLYFEALAADGKTRILSIDSKDGLVGKDFNSGTATTCGTSADYSAGGGCAPSVVIGVEGDANLANPRISNARQFKIGFPTRDDWRWDESIGTYMVFTTGAVPGCSSASRNHGYALYGPDVWQVQYRSDGCPKLFTNIQAGHPLHLGGVRYKMYYGDTSDLSAAIPGSMLPFLGRKRVIYADAERTSDPRRVDFEDWETTAQGRSLIFLWPDGSMLSATAEGYIDDFSIVLPTNDSSLQVLYIAITDGQIAPITGAAILLNP